MTIGVYLWAAFIWLLGALLHWGLCLRLVKRMPMNGWLLPAVAYSLLWPMTLAFAPILVLYLLFRRPDQYEHVMEAGRVVNED